MNNLQNLQFSIIAQQNDFGRKVFQGLYSQIPVEMKKQVVIALQTKLERL